MFNLQEPIVAKVQEVLDKAAEAMCKQKAVCIDSEGDCANYNDAGQRCAFGWVLHLLGFPDSHINASGSYLITAKYALNCGDYDNLNWVVQPYLNSLWQNIQNLHDIWSKDSSGDLEESLRIFETLKKHYPQVDFSAWEPIANGDWLK